jgi:predicted alpha/beta hydrolase
MKISKVLHVLSVISGVLGVLSFLGLFGGGMMSGFSGMMGYGQGYVSMPMGSIVFILIAIWLQIATIHHIMLEKKGELV